MAEARHLQHTGIALELTVDAIVLRRRDSGESDRRLTLLTREQGKIDVIAKGARKAGSRLAGSSDPLAMARFNLATGKKNLFITQTQPISSFRGLRSDYERLTFALSLCELYAALLPFEQPLPEAFELLVISLSAVEQHTKPLVAFIWAQLKCLELSGFLPSFESSAVSGEAVKEADPFVSPHAGGYVTEAEAMAYTDRVRTRAEVLYGLGRTSELDEPPPNLKFAPEAASILLRFWRNVVDAPIPATESCIAQVLHL